MSEILYNDVLFPSGYSCNVCTSCCVGRIRKKAGKSNNIPLEIDWTDSNLKLLIEPTDLIKKVEFAAQTSAGCEVPVDCDKEPIFGATHVKNGPARLGRRSASGPFSTARIWGGNKCSNYKLFAHVVYERCGHCFDETLCWDVEMLDC